MTLYMHMLLGAQGTLCCPAGTAVSLNVSVGGCQYNFSYGYYSAPLVRRVHPECGPRYGSFPLTVYLDDSLDNVSHGKVLVTPCMGIRISASAKHGVFACDTAQRST